MATSKNGRRNHKGSNECFGLMANGSSGSWEIAIDEATSGADQWFAQLEGPSVSFYFEIPSVAIVAKMLQFLEARPAVGEPTVIGSDKQNGILTIGKAKRTPVYLIKDDEYPDRFFIVVGRMDSPIVRFVLAGADVINIADALRQVKDDLEEED